MIGASDDKLREVLSGLSYEDKVRLYDSKCNQCPYKLIVVEDVEDKNGNAKEFQDINEAISVSITCSKTIYRLCAYPTNLTMKRTKNGYEPIYPDIDDITKNACKFWKL